MQQAGRAEDHDSDPAGQAQTEAADRTAAEVVADRSDMWLAGYLTAMAELRLTLHADRAVVAEAVRRLGMRDE